MVLFIPIFTPKQLAGVLVLICISVIIHIWYAYYILEFANDVSTFLTIANGRFRKTFPVSEGKDIKFILMWKTDVLANKFLPKLNCLVQNCIFTENELLLRDYTSFDAVIFNENILNSVDRPKLRSSSQLYVFATLQSPCIAPACELYNDNFFNWTLTYRLDSSVLWHNFVVRNHTGAVVAPSLSPVWENDDGPVPVTLKSILLGKKKVAALIVSDCNANTERATYVMALQEHLYHFSLNVDVFGKCSGMSCPGDDCDEIIKRDYYFYIAFENSIAEDYVTQKVLYGYNNYAVPIVCGGANYSRFLPPGSYVDAMQLHPHNLAHAMKQIIDDPQLYEKYFKWTNLYTIDSDPMINNPLCSLCEAMDEVQAKNSPAIKDFRIWWNGGRDGMKWCLNQHYLNDTDSIESHLDPGQFYSPLVTMQYNYKTKRLVAHKNRKNVQKPKNRSTSSDLIAK